MGFNSGFKGLNIQVSSRGRTCGSAWFESSWGHSLSWGFLSQYLVPQGNYQDEILVRTKPQSPARFPIHCSIITLWKQAIKFPKR